LKVNRKSERILKSWMAERLFGSLYLLLHLCDIEKQTIFLEEYYSKTKNNKLPEKILNGYKFALNALLHTIITVFIQEPGCISLRRSQKIDWDYLFGDETKSIHKLSHLSAQGILIKNLLFFRRKILKTKNWNELKSEVYGLQDFLIPLREIFLSCYSGKQKGSKQSMDPETALATKLPGVLLVFLNDGKNLEISFKEMYRQHKPTLTLKKLKQPLDFKGEGPSDGLFMFHRSSQLDEIAKAEVFLEGFKFANISLWRLVLGKNEFSRNKEIFRELQKVESWSEFDDVFEKINDNIVFDYEEKAKTKQIHMFLPKKVPSNLRHKLIIPINKPKSVQTQLSDVFHNRPAKIIGYEGGNGTTQFCTLLKGFACLQIIEKMPEKISVIEFIHNLKDRGNDYSYAVFMPASSNIADYSRWWVFYRCATDHSGFGGQCYRYIHSVFEKLSDSIHVKKFSIDEKSFFEYFKSDYVRFIEKECKQAKHINSGLRGAYLELLVAFIFIKNGFEVHLRHRSKVIGKEIDVVAIKQENRTSIVYVVECKERSVTVDPEEFDRIAKIIFKKLREEKEGMIGVSPSDAVLKIIEDFRNEKVIPLKNNLPKFAKELGFLNDKKMKLIGVVATTELFEGSINIYPDIELWTYWSLKEKIRDSQIDPSFIQIIEKYLEGSAGRTISDLHFSKDYFD